jgi:hypothetical protein
MPRLTTDQKQGQLDLAHTWLEVWQTRCREHAALVKLYERQYGDHGPLIAGCHRDHFPSIVKDSLRLRAREITSALDHASDCWRLSGKRMHTFRRVLDRYRQHG